MRETTSTGPAPFPRSSARLKIAKAVPLVSGRQTFSKRREKQRERERGKKKEDERYRSYEGEERRVETNAVRQIERREGLSGVYGSVVIII